MGPAPRSKVRAAGRKSIPSPARPAAPGPAPGPFLGQLHRRLGNNAVRGLVEARLAVSEPTDAEELDAERMADRIMRMGLPLQDSGHSGSGAAGPPRNRSSAGPLPPDFLAALGSGRPLEPDRRDFMEARFGLPFDDVRIHAGPTAAAAARLLHARAYTAGAHIAFGEGQYQPDTSAGRRLLAHELAHVLQQRRGGSVRVQRQVQGAAEATELLLWDLGNGVIVRQEPLAGWATVSYKGRPWIRLKWRPGGVRRIWESDLILDRKDPGVAVRPRVPRAHLSIRAAFPIQATVDRSVEQNMSDDSALDIAVDLDLEFAGSLTVVGAGTERVLQDAPAHLHHTYQPHLAPLTATVEGKPVTADPPNRKGQPLLPPAGGIDHPVPNPPPVRRTLWLFENDVQVDAFVASRAEPDWAGIGLPDGRVLAYELSEKMLQGMADQVRAGSYDFAPQRDLPGARVYSVYLRKHKLESVNDLGDLYFRDPHDAAPLRVSAGVGAEYEVFRMGTDSLLYGRRPLSHSQALARWQELDALSAKEIALLQSEPGRPFEALQALGVSRLHYLDWRHFEARDDLLAFSKSAGAGHLSIPPDTAEMRYLLVEADREQPDSRTRALLLAQPDIARTLQDQAFWAVEKQGQQIAIDALDKSIKKLDQLAESPTAMSQFVLGFADLDEADQEQALLVLGFQREDTPGVTLPAEAPLLSPDGMVLQWYLKNREMAALMARGETVYGMDLSFLADHLRPRVQELKDVLLLLETWQVQAIRVDGPMGLEARKQAYHALGFTRLDPSTYPHRKETKGLFPEPLSGEGGDFASLTEQLYANRAASMANNEVLIKVLYVTGAALVTVALILAANAAGAAAAGLLFAEGTAAFAVTEVVAAGTVFTGLEIIAGAALYGDTPESWEDVGKKLAFNIATFGFFKALGAVLGAGSMLAARELAGLSAAELKAAQAAGTAIAAEVQTTATVIRLSTMGTTFIGLSIAQFRIQTGRLPTAEEAALLAYESVLTLVMLEAGAAMTRSMTDKIGLWARAQRLGVMQEPIQRLFADIRAFNADLAGYTVNPQAIERDAPSIVAREQELLERKRALVGQLREQLRTRGDAKQVDKLAADELQLIGTSLDLLRQAEFLTAAEVRPKGQPAAPEDPLEFTFRAGAEDKIRRFYGADKVRPGPNGSLRVTHEGRELIFWPEKAGATGAKDTANRRQLVFNRQRAVLVTAARLELSDPAIEKIRNLRPGDTKDSKRLDRTERLIGDAERVIGSELQRASARALERHTRRLGSEAMKRARAGLDMTDQQVGMALDQLPPGSQGLGEYQIRGVLYAAKGPPAGSTARPIDLTRLFDLARSAAERNFVLDTFGRFMEARIPGTYDVLSEMTAGANPWRGGAWLLEYARLGVSLDQIAAFEVQQIDPLTGGERWYDIVLTDRTRLELKDWRNWFADSLRSQFRRDVLISTAGFTDPAGIQHVRWVFRAPGPVDAAEIRATMREALENLMEERKLGDDLRQQLRREFDAHSTLIEISTASRDSVALPPVPSKSPTPLLPDRPKEKPDAGVPLPDTGILGFDEGIAPLQPMLAK